MRRRALLKGHWPNFAIVDHAMKERRLLRRHGNFFCVREARLGGGATIYSKLTDKLKMCRGGRWIENGKS